MAGHLCVCFFSCDALKSSEIRKERKGEEERQMGIRSCRSRLVYIDGISVKSIPPIARCVTLPQC